MRIMILICSHPARVYEDSQMLLEMNVLCLSDLKTINVVCLFAQR